MGILDRFRKTQPETAAKGRSGTVNVGGFISETEFNAALRHPQSITTYDQMRRSDATVRWMLALVKNPIRAATWAHEPVDASDEAREVAALCDHALTECMAGGFDDVLRRILTFLDFGHSAFELIARMDQVEFTYETQDGDEIEVAREAFVVHRLAERLQHTLVRFVPSKDDPSELAYIEQFIGDGQGEVNPQIDAERLVLFTNEQEGDDWRGTSILRTAYRPYNYKLKLENLEAIAYERSTGLPVVYPPKNVKDPQLDAVEDALKDLRQGQSVYFIAPGPKAGTVEGEDGWLLEAVTVAGDAEQSASDIIARHEASMARNVLAEFMRLGHENVGARATADVQQDPYWQAINAYVGMIEDVLTEQVTARLVAWNYGDAPVPRLKASNVTAKNVEVLAKAAASLLGAGGIEHDLDTENAMREWLDLPRRRPDEESNPGEPPVPPDQIPPGNGSSPEDPQQKAKDALAGLLSEPPGKAFVAMRALLPPERFVAFAEIARRLDRAQESFPAVVENAARPAIEAALRQVEEAQAMNSPEAVAQVSVDDAGIARAVERELGVLHDEGRRTVRDEIRRQSKGQVSFEEVPQRSAAIFLAQALTAASTMAGAATRAIRNRALKLIEDGQAPTGPGFEPFAALRAEATGVALGLTTSAFNAGRDEELRANVTELSSVAYSAILDDNTCGPCNDADGAEGQLDDLVPAPNPGCEGGGACRCIHVGVVREFALPA